MTTSPSTLKSLPVVMSHYVNELEWRITLNPAGFEEQCHVLAERGYRGISLDEAENYLVHGESLPKKSLLLTFDDGYADNYFYALPILAKYGHKGVCFPVTNRLEAEDKPRASFDAVREGKVSIPPHVARPVVQKTQDIVVRQDIFLNHGEVRALDASGIFQIGVHGRGHYGVYTGPKYSRFFQPRTQMRTFYRTEDNPVWGLPEFSVKPGLQFRAFLPNPLMVEAIKKLVPQEFTAATDFFAHKDGLPSLRALADSFSGKLGRYETDAERHARMRREIVTGKEELEQILGRKVHTFCWPWGKYCDEAFCMARDAGFKLFFVVSRGANPPGKPLAVHRFDSRNGGKNWLARQAWLHEQPLLASLLGVIG
ncbi:MAG: polysaccharide deacetylase family protein, partial [Desulfovibrio sp.]|nr:polysaccharide deacetylase family protein [Desulfovibrio sp.]